MRQHSLGLGATAKRTRPRQFLDEMEKVVPRADLVALVSQYLPEDKRDRPPYSPETILRIQFIQRWFALSDPAREEVLHDMSVFREFAGLEVWEAQTLQTVDDQFSAKGMMLKSGTVVDATLIAAPSSTKNSSGERDPEMKQSRKGQQWYFGMKCHIGADIESGLVHTVRGTSGAVNDVIKANSLVRSSDREVLADAGYQGADKRSDARDDVTWHIVMRPGLRKPLDPSDPMDRLVEQKECVKAGIRARVKYPFRVVKRQFGPTQVRYRGLAKNTAQLHRLFAHANLWLVRRKLIGAIA